MKTAEEILDNACKDWGDLTFAEFMGAPDKNDPTYESFLEVKEVIVEAMKAHAIECMKEIHRQGYVEYDESDRWISPSQSNMVYTTEQIYEKFEKLQPC